MFSMRGSIKCYCTHMMLRLLSLPLHLIRTKKYNKKHGPTKGQSGGSLSSLIQFKKYIYIRQPVNLRGQVPDEPCGLLLPQPITLTPFPSPI